MVFWTSIKRKLNKINQYTLADGLLILEAWLTLAFFSLGLRRESLRRLEELPAIQLSGRQVINPDQLGRLVSVSAGLHPWLRMTCLVRTLALRWMMRRRGVPSDLCLGVKRDEGSLLGHAWLEIDGEPVGEPQDRLKGYSVLSHG